VFKAMYESLASTLFIFANRMLQDREEARDIVNNAFLKLLEHGTPLETFVKVKPFLYSIVRNACIDHLRRVDTAKRNSSNLSHLQYSEQVGEDGFDDLRSKVLAKIYQEIEKLPTSCREIFKLSYLEGLKNREIAEKLAINEKTVRNQISKARKKLRGIFMQMLEGRQISFVGLVIMLSSLG